MMRKRAALVNASALRVPAVAAMHQSMTMLRSNLRQRGRDASPIRKSGNQFSEKIMLKQRDDRPTGFNLVEVMFHHSRASQMALP
jgi:hypothetical protein